MARLYVKTSEETRFDVGSTIRIVWLAVIETLESCDLQACKELADRIVSSSVICKSARLRDLFLYLCNRVLLESADDIHELELGHKVFGRPEHYDTAADNIVRVHASILRKRLAEYFLTEGANESLIIEIPKGNYAPIFRRRDLLNVIDSAGDKKQVDSPPALLSTEPAESPMHRPLSAPIHPASSMWRTFSFVLGGLAVLFALLFAFQLVQGTNQRHRNLIAGDTVRLFWSGLFQKNAPTSVVLDDASLDFYQEATGHSISLTEYFDRSYLHPLEEAAAAAHLDPKLAHSFLLRRQSNFAGVNLIERFSQTAQAFGTNPNIFFARDFSFRQARSGNMILLGTRQSNPWIQSFDSYLALRWKFDPALEGYYPIDSTRSFETDQVHVSADNAKSHESYASVAFLPNLAGTGNVLIVSGTGGASVTSALDFLNDDASMSQLRSRITSQKKDAFPYFEILLKIEKGGNLPRSVTIVLARAPQPISSRNASAGLSLVQH